MSDCYICPVEKDCFYEYKPCDCVHQRKFKSKTKKDSVIVKNPNGTRTELVLLANRE